MREVRSGVEGGRLRDEGSREKRKGSQPKGLTDVAERRKWPSAEVAAMVTAARLRGFAAPHGGFSDLSARRAACTTLVFA